MTTHKALQWTKRQSRILQFQSNLCVLAGAGSGKTMTLVGLMLKLMEDSTSDIPINISQILALTYTEKAAREMRNRIRLGINERISNAQGERRIFWIEQRRLLDRAQISTIHGFCLLLLRQVAMDTGVDPDFTILGEDRDMIPEFQRNILLNILDNGDKDLLDLLRFFSWPSKGRGIGIDNTLDALINRSRTYGKPPVLGEASPDCDMISNHIAQVEKAADLADEYIKSGVVKKGKAYYDSIADFIRTAREELDRIGTNRDILDIKLIDNIKKTIKGNWQKAKPARDMAGEALDALEGLYSHQLSQPLKGKLLALTEIIQESLDETKKRMNIMDFDDLLLTARRVLAEYPEVRSRIKQKYKVVLMDEFQDTNRLQAEILALLTEPVSSDRIPGNGESLFQAMALEDRKLVVFGDPKQSIYRFRGAEVEVFQHIRESILNPSNGAAGQMIPLDTNFRSRRELIDFFNAFFPVLPTSNAEYAFRYNEEDTQCGHRTHAKQQISVVLIKTPDHNNAAVRRSQDALAVASYIRQIVEAQIDILVGDGRRALVGDIAILLRRFTHLKAYEDALRLSDIPFYTVRGKGFYNCPEITDLINLLQYLSDPGRQSELAGALRSPLFGVDDRTITRLVHPGPNASPVRLSRYFQANPLPFPMGLDARQIQILEMAKEILSNLSTGSGRAFAAELIEQAVEQTNYLAVLSAQEQGAQKVANVQRFVEISRSLTTKDLFAPGELARFLNHRLQDLVDDPEAQIVNEDAQAVKIMTIHQAKGLQFPIIFLPDAESPAQSRPGSLVFGPNDAFSFAFRDPETKKKLKPDDYTRFQEEEKVREQAENLRLLYVAATRAQDFLVISGSDRKSKNETAWLSMVDQFAVERPDLVHSINWDSAPDEPDVSVSEEKAPFSRIPEIHPGQSSQEGQNFLERVLAPQPGRARIVTLPVTDLNTFLACPRQYYLSKILGLPEQSDARPSPSPSRNEGLSPREKGILFHYLLETLIPGQEPDHGRLERKARERAGEGGWRISEEETTDLSARVMEFLRSPWGRELTEELKMLEREYPFWLKIEAEEPEGPTLILNGEIDLFYINSNSIARVIDYKLADPSETARYEPQIKTYALALLKAGLSRELEAGFYFSGERGGQTVRISLEQNWRSGFKRELRQVARAIVDYQERLETPTPIDPCPHTHCGWRYTCPEQNHHRGAGLP